MRRSRRSTPHLASVYAIALCSLTALVGHRAAAQGTASPPAFSVDDALNVVSYSQSNLSDDGRWLATVALSRRDGVGVDYRRDGDPTYVRREWGQTGDPVDPATVRTSRAQTASRTRPWTHDELLAMLPAGRGGQ